MEAPGAMEPYGEQLSANTQNAIVAQNEGLPTQSLLNKRQGKTPLQQEFRERTSDASDTVKSWFVLKHAGTSA